MRRHRLALARFVISGEEHIERAPLARTWPKTALNAFTICELAEAGPPWRSLLSGRAAMPSSYEPSPEAEHPGRESSGVRVISTGATLDTDFA